MKSSLVLPLAVASQLLAGPVLAQGSGKNVTIFRMAGPQLGVRLEEVDHDVASRLKLKEERGALVTEVLENSAAAKALIKKDDVILKYQGEAVLTAAQLGRLVRDTPAGRKVEIDLLRAGAPVKVTATIERAEFSEPDHPAPPDFEDLNEKLGALGDLRFKSREGASLPRTFNFKLDGNGPGLMAFASGGRGRLGITYTEIEGQLAAYFKAPKDNAILVNSVVEDSPAEKAGVKAGDLLLKVGGASIEETSDLQEAVSDLEPGKTASLTVWRDGRSVELSVTLSEPKAGLAAPRRRRPVS